MTKNSHISKYIAAFAITTLIFVVGIVIGNYISSAKLSTIDDLQQDLAQKTASSELQYLLMAEYPCESVNATELTEELFDIGSRLDFMENKLGKKNRDVINLKKYYFLLEIRHWLFLKKAKEECGINSNLIMYFYSNLGDCKECQQQGYVLNTIHNNFPSVNIYSFDINIDDPSLRTLRRIYGVDSTPTLVVNGELLVGFHDKAKVEAKIILDDKEESNASDEKDGDVESVDYRTEETEQTESTSS